MNNKEKLNDCILALDEWIKTTYSNQLVENWGLRTPIKNVLSTLSEVFHSEHNDVDFKDRSYQAMQLLAEIYNSKKIYKAEIFTQEFIHKVRCVLSGSNLDTIPNSLEYMKGYEAALNIKDVEIKEIRQALGKEFQDRMYDAAVKTMAPIMDLVSQIKEEKRKAVPFPDGGIVGEKTGGKSALTKDEVEQVISTKGIVNEFMKRAKLAENPILDQYLKEMNAIYHDINIHIALEKFADWQASKGIVTGEKANVIDEIYKIADEATEICQEFRIQCTCSDGYISDEQVNKCDELISRFCSIQERGETTSATSSIFSEQKNAPQDPQIKAAGERNKAYINERSTLPIDEQLIELGQDLAHLTLNAVNVDLAQWLKHQLTPFADRLIKLYRKREKDNGAEMYKVLAENQPKAPTIDDLREAAGIQKPVKADLESSPIQDTKEGIKAEKGATNKKSSHVCGIKPDYFAFLDEYVNKNTEHEDYAKARLWMPHRALNELRDKCDGAYRAYCFHLENKGRDHE